MPREPHTAKTILKSLLLALADRPHASVPELRPLRANVSRLLRPLPVKDVLSVALGVLNSPAVPKWIAFELIHHHEEAFRSLNVPILTQLGKGLGAWGEVDPFATLLVGPAWRENLVSDNVIHRWARSKDHWWRRTAVVSTVALNNSARGGAGDKSRTLAVCELLKNDRDDMVVKALSWALRELAKKEPDSVRTFLADNQDILAARVIREVRNKIVTGLKNPSR